LNYLNTIFPSLVALPCKAVLIGRLPGVELAFDRAEVLRHLEQPHREQIRKLGLHEKTFVTCQQVGGKQLACISASGAHTFPVPGCDGLLTDDPGVLLGMYVADCCAVYLVDPKRPGIALVHSGKKGTELGIVEAAILEMQERFGSVPGELRVQLSPCIRPPHYEVDFAKNIIESCRAQGVQHIYDSGECTASNLERYYSYRKEKGKTGRMLALLSLSG